MSEEKEHPFDSIRKSLDELENECSHLAANQCLYGLHGDEGGNQYCPEVKKLRDHLKDKDNTFDEMELCYVQRITDRDKQISELREALKQLIPIAESNAILSEHEIIDKAKNLLNHKMIRNEA